MKSGLADRGFIAGKILPGLLLCLSAAAAHADKSIGPVLTIGSVALSQVAGESPEALKRDPG